MLALTLWRPWPWAILYPSGMLKKRIENRGWLPPQKMMGQRFALHAGKRFDAGSERMIRTNTRTDWGDPSFSAHAFEEGVVGVATLLEVLSSCDEVKRRAPDQLAWWSGPFAWLLGDVRPLAVPVECKGFQKLWNLPADVERKVLEQL